MNMEELNEVTVKDEQIDDSQSISDTSSNNKPKKIIENLSIKHERQFIPKPKRETTKRNREDMSIDDQPDKRKRQSIKVKVEPIDSEMETSKTQIEVKAEEKFSAAEEFANKSSIHSVSIGFLNEETSEKSQPNKWKSK